MLVLEEHAIDEEGKQAHVGHLVEHQKEEMNTAYRPHVLTRASFLSSTRSHRGCLAAAKTHASTQKLEALIARSCELQVAKVNSSGIHLALRRFETTKVLPDLFLDR